MKKYNTAAVSWIRNQLKVKGKSLHSGRGSYACLCNDLTRIELVERVKAKLEEWLSKNMIEKVEEDEDSISIWFKDLFKDEYYKTFVFHKSERFVRGDMTRFYCCM